MHTDEPFPAALDAQAGQELVALARETVRRVATDETPPVPEHVDGRLTEAGGAFVTIERGERLRGCCGRVDPEEPLWEVVRTAAADAARADPRCPPVDPAEVPDLSVTVTVLSQPEDVGAEAPEAYIDRIEIGRDGLIASRGDKGGVLLPSVPVERGWRHRAFLTATCQKAGLPGDAWRRDAVDVERFTARAFEKEGPGGDLIDRRYDGSTDESKPEAGPSEVAETGGGKWPDRRVTDGGRPRNAGRRPPAVAGKFYAESPDGLREQLAECVEHEYGPGPVDAEKSDGSEAVTGLVSPHAGYQFSGPVAAHGFAALAGGPEPETVVLFGPNHGGVGADVAVSPHERWETPLGAVDVDDGLASAIVDRSEVATFDGPTHAGEHSIEVQLPFLQYWLEDVSVVPICLTHPGRDRAEQLGTEVAAAIDATGREAAVVSSTDLTHYESHESAVVADEPLVESIADLETDAVARAVERGHSMCGPWATVAGLTAASALGGDDGRRLQYATSGQTDGRSNQVVGYCSVVIY